MGEKQRISGTVEAFSLQVRKLDDKLCVNLDPRLMEKPESFVKEFIERCKTLGLCETMGDYENCSFKPGKIISCYTISGAEDVKHYVLDHGWTFTEHKLPDSPRALFTLTRSPTWGLIATKAQSKAQRLAA